MIANESYEEFARTLQREFEEDLGIQFGKVDPVAFAKLVRTNTDGRKVGLGQEESARLWSQLVANGYLSAEGYILDRFDPKSPHFDLKVPGEFVDLKSEIVDEINRKLFKNRIADARERRELQFRKEVHLSDEFEELWERIKHRTSYRVHFDTADLVERALARIGTIEPIKAPRVSTTVVAVDISDAGVSADRQIAARVQEVGPVNVLARYSRFSTKGDGADPPYACRDPEALGAPCRIPD